MWPPALEMGCIACARQASGQDCGHSCKLCNLVMDSHEQMVRQFIVGRHPSEVSVTRFLWYVQSCRFSREQGRAHARMSASGTRIGVV